jgi:integrase/recombinase XerD
MHVTWDLWMDLYCETWCVVRNLKASTIRAYRDTLRQFKKWVQREHLIAEPTQITTRVVLEYVVYLREERANGDSAVQRAIVVLKNFYAAMVSFGHLQPRENPMMGFPRIKKGPQKLPTFLTSEELRRLLACPKTDTVLGLRDRAILVLLYATGIRAGECASLLDEWVDLNECTIRVYGKGGRERVIPLNRRAVAALRAYRQARGSLPSGERFFRTKAGRGINRKVVYQRVRKYATEAKLRKRVSPHTLRHTCATHLVQRGEKLVAIRDILGHRLITSTQIYIHTTAQDLLEVARNHPVGELAPQVASLIEGVRIPIDHPPRRRTSQGTCRTQSGGAASRGSPPNHGEAA